MGAASWRIGADIGGTFTDIVLEDPEGQIRSSVKILTTHGAPEDAILEGLTKVTAAAGVAPAKVGQIIHGTTLATNALIERKGAKTALITTEGFRDVIEMRTESRFEQYDLNLVLPEPLLPRQRRLTLRERVGASGEVLIPLQRGDVVALVDQIADGDYDSVAVGFLHSYANPSHERLVGEVLAEKLPGAMVSLSSDVSPQMREYERFNTTIANAYIKPLMKTYLERLAWKLDAQGFVCPIFLMHSGGGLISVQDAAEFPVRLVESGPAGGAVFAADIAARHGLDKVLSFDMGGTTAKICLIRGQTPKTARVFEVARSYRFKKGSGMPISIPVIDMVEIGAGGGSIAHIDSMRQIRVGPHSAGSEPGPACYRRGGLEPAVTDADLVLGRLDADNFAGGSMQLDRARSSEAIASKIGETLEMQPVTAAFGIVEVVDETMANAARVHAVENGEDLSEYTMIAFGGAAPLHAARLCEKLGIERFLVPQGAGVGSAIGFLRAPFSYEALRSVFMRLSEFDGTVATQIFGALEDEAAGFVRSCDASADIRAEHRLYMRYAGQGWEIPVDLTAEQAANPTAETIRDLFEKAYIALFGRAVEGPEIEITVWTVNATTPLPPVAELPQPSASRQAQPGPRRMIFDTSAAEMREAGIFERSDLGPGDAFSGPAAITEAETTIILPSGFAGICASDGCLIVDKKA